MTYSLQEYLKEGILTEARKTGVTYTVKATKDKIERVVATLEGTDSAAMSRLAKRYVRLEASLKAMQEARDGLNERLKVEVSGLFAPEEAVVTRVVNTVSFSLTMAKEVEKAVPESKKKDFEAIANELAKLIPAELQSKVDEITAIYTTVTPASVKPGIKKLSVSPLEEGVVATVKGAIKFIATKVKQFASWATGYDSKLADLESKFKAVKAKKVVKESMNPGLQRQAFHHIEEIGQMLEEDMLDELVNSIDDDEEHDEARNALDEARRVIAKLTEIVR